ncbi:thiamine diphosphokinase [Arenibacterium sp. CAU 1754]
MDIILSSNSPVTLVGGGIVGSEDLALALQHAPTLVAADSGAGPVLDAGLMPDAVIGDFDSLSIGDRARIPQERLFLIDEQDSTDFDKALRHIAAPLVVAVGFLGARVDHQLAAFNALVRLQDRPCVMLGPHEAIFHVPARLSLNLSDGDVVSLFPMSPVRGRSKGLEWPIDDLHLSPNGRVGTSNRARGPIQLEMDGPGLLALVPRSAFGSVISTLMPERAGAA